MKGTLKTILTLSITVMIFTSCNSSNGDRTVTELVEHLNSNGFEGTISEKAFVMIGAIDGCGYHNDIFNIEIYKFKDANTIPDMLPYKNSNFGMLVHKPSEEDRQRIVDIFMSFK